MKTDWVFLKATLEEIAEQLGDLRIRFETLENDIGMTLDEIEEIPEVKNDGAAL